MEIDRVGECPRERTGMGVDGRSRGDRGDKSPRIWSGGR